MYFPLDKLPKPRPFKEFHLKRMAHIGYVLIKKHFQDGEFIVLECNMNGHWFGMGLGKDGTHQWWPSRWHNVTTKDEVDNKRMNYEYEFFNSFEELNEAHRELVKMRVLTKAPNDFSDGDFTFTAKMPEWKRLLRNGWPVEKIISLSFRPEIEEAIKAYIEG